MTRPGVGHRVVLVRDLQAEGVDLHPGRGLLRTTEGVEHDRFDLGRREQERAALAGTASGEVDLARDESAREGHVPDKASGVPEPGS